MSVVGLVSDLPLHRYHEKCEAEKHHETLLLIEDPKQLAKDSRASEVRLHNETRLSLDHNRPSWCRIGRDKTAVECVPCGLIQDPVSLAEHGREFLTHLLQRLSADLPGR